jgi:hypothetical protein
MKEPIHSASILPTIKPRPTPEVPMKTDRKSRTSRKAPFLTSLALACAFMTGNAGAGIPVTDVGNMPNHIITQIQSYLNQLNTYTSKIQDGIHQGRDWQHMIQQLTSLGMIFDSFQLKFTQDFKTKSLTDGMSDRCGGGIGGMISDLMSSISLSGDGDIIQQQKVICQRIVMLENQKYNDQVDYLNAIMNQMQADIDRAKSQARSADTNGKEGTNGIMLELTAIQKDKDDRLAIQRSEAFDEMISTLETQQKNLARIAMNGKTSVLGTIANTAILAGALKVNE